MWKDLTMQEKADIMKLSLANGISSLKTIREQYNKYAENTINNLIKTKN
jgi:hypothetical protein